MLYESLNCHNNNLIKLELESNSNKCSINVVANRGQQQQAVWLQVRLVATWFIVPVFGLHQLLRKSPAPSAPPWSPRGHYCCAVCYFLLEMLTRSCPLHRNVAKLNDRPTRRRNSQAAILERCVWSSFSQKSLNLVTAVCRCHGGCGCSSIGESTFHYHASQLYWFNYVFVDWLIICPYLLLTPASMAAMWVRPCEQMTDPADESGSFVTAVPGSSVPFPGSLL